jgi:hypothetical protein
MNSGPAAATLCVVVMLLAAAPAVQAQEAAPPSPEASEPEQVVQRQLEAYNARDLEAFLAPYAEDVEIYGFPDTPWIAGRDAMRESYRRLFDGAPDLHAEITGRIVQGEYVIDHERVTGIPDRPLLEAVAIYRVHEGRITHVWFIY